MRQVIIFVIHIFLEGYTTPIMDSLSTIAFTDVDQAMALMFPKSNAAWPSS